MSTGTLCPFKCPCQLMWPSEARSPLITGALISSAQFNESGDLLFAWIEHKDQNFVYVWRIDHKTLSFTLESPRPMRFQRVRLLSFHILFH